MDLSTLKRAWNLAATLLLASPAIGGAVAEVLSWILAAAFGYAVWTWGRKAIDVGAPLHRPADSGSTPGASTRSTTTSAGGTE